MPPRELRLAILIWRSGRPISLDLAVSLMELGYDVERLEARYLRS